MQLEVFAFLSREIDNQSVTSCWLPATCCDVDIYRAAVHGHTQDTLFVYTSLHCQFLICKQIYIGLCTVLGKQVKFVMPELIQYTLVKSYSVWSPCKFSSWMFMAKPKVLCFSAWYKNYSVCINTYWPHPQSLLGEERAWYTLYAHAPKCNENPGTDFVNFRKTLHKVLKCTYVIIFAKSAIRLTSLAAIAKNRSVGYQPDKLVAQKPN